MYTKLYYEWTATASKGLAPSEIAAKVKRFFFYYSINRHKMCTLTPSYHAEGYSPDDNRYDLRPFLYNSKWTRQFHQIDQLAKQYEEIEEEEIIKEASSSTSTSTSLPSSK